MAKKKRLTLSSTKTLELLRPRVELVVRYAWLKQQSRMPRHRIIHEQFPVVLVYVKELPFGVMLRLVTAAVANGIVAHVGGAQYSVKPNKALPVCIMMGLAVGRPRTKDLVEALQEKP